MDNIEELVKIIYNDGFGPKSRNKIIINFSEIDNINMNIIEDILIEILIKLIAKIFKCDINDLTMTDFEILQQYFNSFGFNINLCIEEDYFKISFEIIR